LDQLAIYDQQGIETVFKEFCADLGIKMGQIGPVVRVAMCGVTTSPGIYEVLEVLGKDETMKRLARAVEYMKHRDQ
jgi:glutamyl-tRNA synthetase